jgi:RNA polymerase sigma-70 factor (ECF subfamily)
VADAEDVLQEALFEAWRRVGGQPPEKALVFATIRRRAMDLARRNDRRQRREESADPPEPCFVVDFAAGDTRAQLAAAIDALPEHLREVLTLRLWGGLEFPEIARLTGVPMNTAASRYRYALENLREKLAAKLQ